MIKTYGAQDMSEIFKRTTEVILQDGIERPWTLPPLIDNQTRLWLADNVNSWLKMHEEKSGKWMMPHKNLKSTPTEKRGARMKTYGIEEMSVLFKLAPSTIQNHLKRKPWTLPPRVVIPGSSRLLWIADTVDSWLLMHEEKEVKNPRKNFKSLPAEKTVSLNENIKHITPHPFQKNHWRGF